MSVDRGDFFLIHFLPSKGVKVALLWSYKDKDGHTSGDVFIKTVVYMCFSLLHLFICT